MHQSNQHKAGRRTERLWQSQRRCCAPPRSVSQISPMPGRMAGVGAGVSTGADLAASTVAEWVDFTVASRVCTGADLAGFTGAASTGIDFTMAGSVAIDFATTVFSSVERSHIPVGGITLQTMAIMTTASPTPRRCGIIAPILPAITLM